MAYNLDKYNNQAKRILFIYKKLHFWAPIITTHVEVFASKSIKVTLGDIMIVAIRADLPESTPGGNFECYVTRFRKVQLTKSEQ